MAAGNHDFLIEQGATFQVTLTYKDGNQTPIPLTGCTVRMQIRKKVADQEYVCEATTENNKIKMDEAANGIIKIIISAAETASFTTWKAGVYDIEVVYPNGTVDRILQGKVTLSLNVTRG